MIANFQAENNNFSLESVYKIIGRSRQSFWKAKQQSKSNHDLEDSILIEVKKVRKNHPRMGSRVLYHTIQNTSCSLKIGINKFEAILQKNNLTIPPNRKWKPKTSDGKGKRDYPNLVNGLVLTDVNQLWVSDITYFRIQSTFFYVFTIKDVYSQRMLENYQLKN